MTRRDFAFVASGLAAPSPPRSILVHEHVLVDFIGADQIKPGRYDPDEVFRAAKPKLDAIRKFGCVRLLEATPNFLGRDARLMKRLSDATGVDIWINTGIYGAAQHKFVPAFARTETAEQLARRWIEEVRRGVDGVKPRFIKTGVSGAPLDEVDRKLIAAAALTSRETGLTIASHTDAGAAALEEVEIVVAHKVSPAKFVWVHAHSEKDHALHEKFVRTGAWLEFDGLGPKSADWHLECFRWMSQNGFLSQALISHDAGWYRPGEPGGGNYRDYTYLYTDFLARLDPAWIPALLWDNPVRAYGK
ncbi:MAG: phosphotriesterase [Acidobacteria bacterium]|nr:phosphotriesterase [Acidobacteriota bacterium]